MNAIDWPEQEMIVPRGRGEIQHSLSSRLALVHIGDSEREVALRIDAYMNGPADEEFPFSGYVWTSKKKFKAVLEPNSLKGHIYIEPG